MEGTESGAQSESYSEFELAFQGTHEAGIKICGKILMPDFRRDPSMHDRGNARTFLSVYSV
jgi:hypothetical protein